jgi:hypothetical protein
LAVAPQQLCLPHVHQACFQLISYGLGWARSPRALLGAFQKLVKLHYRFIV